MRVIRWAAAAAMLAAALAIGAGSANAAARSAQPTRAVMVLLDVNTSFPAAAAVAEQAAAVAYLRALPSDVQAGLITFNGHWAVVLQPTTNHQAVTAAVGSAGRSGYISGGLSGALSAAESALSGLGATVDGRILVLSDAEEEAGTAPTSTMPVDVVAWQFESDDDKPMLASLAAATGGQIVAPAMAASLAAAFPAVSPSPERSAPAAPIPAVANPAPVSAPWHFSASLLAAVAALMIAIAGVVVLVAGAANSGRKGRRLAAHVAQYGPTQAAPRPADRSAQSKDAPRGVAGAALGVAERALQARGTDRKLADRLDLAGMTAKPAEFVVLGACASVVLAAALTILLRTALIGVPAGLVAGWLGMRLLLSIRIGRRRAAFGEQLPDVLQLLASSLQSGFSLAQAFDAVVREGSQPAAGEFSRALGEARIGADLTDALDGVAARMSSQDMRWTVMAIRIQRSVGGNLAEVLRNTVATMRERSFLRRHVKALSAEGRLSAYILVALPILLSGWLFYSSPTYMSLLYTTVYGVLMLSGAAVLVVVGALWMRALIKVEV